MSSQLTTCFGLCLSHQVEYDGLTGHIEFNSKGQRTNYTLKILEKHPGGHKEVRGQMGSKRGAHGGRVKLAFSMSTGHVTFKRQEQLPVKCLQDRIKAYYDVKDVYLGILQVEDSDGVDMFSFMFTATVRLTGC